MRTSDMRRPRLDLTRERIRDHRTDAYERTFRQFVAALKDGNEPRALELREELRRLVRDEDRG